MIMCINSIAYMWHTFGQNFINKGKSPLFSSTLSIIFNFNSTLFSITRVESYGEEAIFQCDCDFKVMVPYNSVIISYLYINN